MAPWIVAQSSSLASTKRGAGVTPEEAARLIIKPILKQAEGAAVDRVKDELKQGVMDKVGEAAGDFMDKTKKLFKSGD